MVCNNFMLASCNLQNCSNATVCIMSSDNRKFVTCAENQKKYELENDNRVLITNYHIDTGIITAQTIKKCDYLFYVPSSNKIILIELKGTSYRTAIEQILSTINILSANFKTNKVYARIICQGVPNIQNDPQSIQLTKYLKETGGNFKSTTNFLNEKESKI